MKQKLIKIFAILGGLVLVNILASYWHGRWDLTQDKRYTVAEPTKNLVRSLDDQVVVKVYLKGDFPPAFERLERAIGETLESFQNVAGNNLAYRFVEPSDPKLQEELAQKGLIATNLFATENGKRTEQLVFPSAIVTYQGKEFPIQFLKANKSDAIYSKEEQLNQAYENVEFEIVSAIKKLSQTKRQRVGLLVSHTKVPPPRFSDLIASLQENYDVFFDVNSPNNYDGLDAIIIPKPDLPFSDDDKFKIDQFIMKGGRALFFVDGARVDSINQAGTFAQPLPLNLDDMFFKYGFRVNNNLVKDMSCAMIPLNVGNMGDQVQVQPMPWRYFPLINNFGKNPITRNMGLIYSRFASTIDSVSGNASLQKTPLLMTSQYTTTKNAPVLIAYNEARQQPDPKEYNGGVKTLAMLVEGKFQSLFNNRILPTDPRTNGFVANAQNGKVLICSDGDLIINDIDYKRNAPLPMGYDRVSGKILANKDFVLYALDYMLSPDGLITARNKQVVLRPLDKIKLKDDRLMWQLLNIVAPLLAVALFGLGWQWWRKKQYST